MRNQFDSCSYEELTLCVHARVQWIREWRRFLKDGSTRQYGHIRSSAVINIATNCLEIKRLLKMRRVLKNSGLRSWDTDRLGDVV